MNSVPGIITEGYGSQNLIITAGYGLWHRIVEEVERVVRSALRLIPIGKERFKAKISVLGDLSAPYLVRKPVIGDFLLSKKTSILTQGYPFKRVRDKVSVTGDLSFKESLPLFILGDLMTKLRISETVLGNLVIKVQKKLKVKGKKDFKKIILEILDEE